ncbi:hypothetical protein HSE3_gp071 [Bacillus phage vB_BceM-HSE3]|nr:hypothetical protein HSE3_gp071 [Bacillus phage vB_BceM-HSE3]
MAKSNNVKQEGFEVVNRAGYTLPIFVIQEGTLTQVVLNSGESAKTESVTEQLNKLVDKNLVKINEL